MPWIRRALPWLLALFVSSCTNGNSLVVQLVSNLGPQSEVDLAHVHVTRGGVTELDVDVPLAGDSSLGRARRLIDLGGLDPTRYEVSVALSLRGTPVQTRRVVRDVAGRTVITVLMTRECVGVMCPAADAAAVECLGGRCVTSGCDEEHPDQCGTPGCHAASECAMSSVACAPAGCSSSGVCFAQADDGLCEVGQICDTLRGCIPAPIGDAGVVSDTGPRPYAILRRTLATDAGATATTQAIDTTGASLLVALVAGFADATLDLSDSAGNVWTPLTRAGPSVGGNGSAGTAMRFFYVARPTTSSAHTFTATASGLFTSVHVSAWSGGTATLDAEVAAGNANGSATLSPGTITPTTSGELVLAGWSAHDDYGANLSSLHLDGGFAILDQQLDPAGESIAVALLIAPTTTPVGPTWTMMPNATTAIAAMAAFR